MQKGSSIGDEKPGMISKKRLVAVSIR